MGADVSVVIVGAGPVGLAAAIEARLAGRSVVVIEPRTTPIDKACGEGLMPGAVTALARLGVHPVGHDLSGIAYASASRRVEHIFVSGAGRGVRRTVLHDALSARATELGVPRIEGKVSGLTQDESGVALSGVGFESLRADWVIAADGLHSTLRRLSGLEGRAQPKGRRRYGIRQHFRVEPWSDLVEVHWTDSAEFYVTPVCDDTVGVAMLGSRGGDFGIQLREVPALWEHLNGAEEASALRGAGPLKQTSRHRTAGRVLLVGDASGYVDALTGEGLRVGFAQSRAAVAAIVAGAPHTYERAWRTSTRDFRVLTSGLVEAARSPLRGRIVPAAVAAPHLFGAIVERLAR
jgi:flavin-dependent dehydrogenase